LQNFNRYHGFVGRAGNIWSNVAFAFRVIGSNYVSFVTSADGSNVDDLRSTITVNANTWYHIVAIFKRPTKTIYINGIERGTETWDNNVYNSTADIIIGGYAYGNGLNYLMKGLIANVQIYNTALTLQEIQYLYQQGLGGGPVRLQNLVAWWPLNGDAKDYSGNNNHGTINGGVTFVQNYNPP
jgi:hypothetical protein